MPTPTGQVLTIIENAANGEISGAELELRALVSNNFEFGATAALLDTKFKDYMVNGVDQSSQPYRYPPESTYSLFAAYNRDFANGTFNAQLDYGWSDEFVTSGGATSAVGRDALGLLNGRVSYAWDKFQTSVALNMKNITDERYNAYSIDLSGLGFIPALQGDPRTVGIELTKSF